MSLALLRKTIGASRRALRLRLFGNNQPVVVNLNHKWYHSKARQTWAKVRTPSISPDILRWGNELHREGYVQLKPGVSRELLDTMHNKADRLFATSEFCTTPIDGAIRLKDGIRKIPEISQLFTSDIVQTVENYYGSFFKIYWVQAYRTLPTDKDADASFLWHVDNCPPQVVKLMVYLTDTQENTGAFRLKPRPLSTQMLSRGFFDRSKNDRFAHILNDANTTKIFEGPKGTSILFLNWACVHRAKHPEIKHRDVAVFFLVPSLVPWDQHLKENMENLSLREDVCPNPAIY
jgi:hypothetical protein